jgi:hypothetical protein
MQALKLHEFFNYSFLTYTFSSFLLIIVKSSHKKATISILSEGLNKTVAVLGKVVLLIRHDDVAPL